MPINKALFGGRVTTASSSSPDRSIKRLSIPEAVAQSLQERILSGEFKEGDALVQETLARDYKVSRMPIREALRQLEASGLVTMEMHKGAVVTSIPLAQISELFDLRVMLEGDLLAHAIPRLKKSHLAKAREIHERLEAAHENDEIGLWGELNWEFHRSFYVAAGRVQTLALVQTVNLQTDRYIRLHLMLTGKASRADAAHLELLNLCEARDTDAAVEYLKNHIRQTGRDLVEALSQARALPSG